LFWLLPVRAAIADGIHESEFTFFDLLDGAFQGGF
jgi:hypothetical protein